MTVLVSDLLNALCVTGCDWAVIEIGKSCELHFRRSDSVFLHLVTEGALRFDGAADEALTAGSFAIVLDGRAHVLRTGTGGRRFEARHFLEDHALDSPPTLSFGDAPRRVRLLSARLSLSRAGGEPISRGLSPILIGNCDQSTVSGPQAFRIDAKAIERAASGAGGMAFLRTVANLLLVQAVRMAIENILPPETTAAEIFGTPQIGTALRLMDTQPEKNWSVSSLAAMVGMSRSAFAALFRQSVGDPPMQYLSKMRIEQSARLLKSNRHSIARIAQDVGYESVSSFARAFKKQFGATPGAYRRSFRGSVHRAPHRPTELESCQV